MRTASVCKPLANHQQNGSWEFSAEVKDLYHWADRFNNEFKLGISEIVIGIANLGRRWEGTFGAANYLGIKNQIVIDQYFLEEWLRKKDYYELYGTLLHELLHAWQEEHGEPGKGSYHNKEYRDKAEEFGLFVSQQGQQDYESPTSPFLDLLIDNGVFVRPFLSHATLMGREVSPQIIEARGH